jgi:hypothetical protein
MQDQETASKDKIEELERQLIANARINRIFSLDEDDYENTGLYACWIFAVLVTNSN